MIGHLELIMLKCAL